jgi:acetyl-CoA/propionyl-CoA carboxylase biotin carboxyl carrier protein
VVESEELAERAEQFTHETTLAAASDGAGTGADRGTLRERRSVVEVDGRRFSVTVVAPEPAYAELARRRRERTRARGAGGAADAVVSPMQGTVLSVEVAEGDDVEAGQVLCVVEAMKMENEVRAHRAGRVTELSVAPGEPIAHGQVICVVVDE